jgi:hypothetical protein
MEPAHKQELDVENASVAPSTINYALSVDSLTSPPASHHKTSHPGPTIVYSKSRPSSSYLSGISAHDHPRQTDAPTLAAPVKLSIKDMDILGASWQVVRQRNNVVILFASGMR